MAEIYLHGDNMERIGLSVEEGKLVMTLELPETSLNKTTKRDKVQFYQTRPLRIDPEHQVFLMKFLEYANMAAQVAQQASGPQIQKQTLGFDMNQFLENILMSFGRIMSETPPEQVKQIFKKWKKMFRELDEEQDE